MTEPTRALGALEERARGLAARAAVHRGKGRPRAFRHRLASLRRDLAETVQGLTRSAPPRATIALEWLLDNEYLVLRAADQMRIDLPGGFYARLPKLEGGERDCPRIEEVAREILVTSERFIDVLQIQRFVRAFQSVTALDIGELWALPAFLRLVVIEEIVSLGAKAMRPGAESDVNERMAAAIGSLRALETTDWAEFFESVSVVDRYLRLEPHGAYARLDFPTRDRYRKAVEELARWSGLSEPLIARAVLEDVGRTGRPLGAHLIGRARSDVERRLGCRPPPSRRLARLLWRYVGVWYFGGVALASAAALLLILLPLVTNQEALPLPLVVAGIILALVPATSVGIALVNELATRLAKPRPLPRLDFSDGVPDDARTLVAVPALLTDAEDVDALLRQLELNSRGNHGPNLPFALLVDPVDADQRELPQDRRLLELVALGIRSLNERTAASGGGGAFLLLTRGREWNDAEGCWMSWERKRGKLEELNRLLLGDPGSSLQVVEGDADALQNIRYVLTLDADTFLPDGVAARLVGTLAHPLHGARFDGEGRVVEGYTVLQPRIDTVSDSTEPTWFARIYQANDGFDLYSRAASDVYQDLFGEGIYAGKGLYDVRAFERSLRGRVPENALLSHDLFEGAHGRAALVTDVGVVEEYPSHPVVHMIRLHRWVRGDWQLLPWLFPVVPTGHGLARNRLSYLDRWKILDNLRRSLLSASLVALAVVGWWWLPGSWWWTGVAVAVLATPAVLPALLGVRPVRPRSGVFRTSLIRTGWAIARAFSSVAFLPWQAWVEADAIVRTVHRLGVSRRHLLQWRSAAATARSVSNGGGVRPGFWLPVWVLVATAALGTYVVGAWLSAAPLLTAWLFSPALATALAKTVRGRPRRMDEESRRALLRLARRTWAYFDRLVTAEDHWLPPDNVQLHPVGEVARRTSPTNIGLGMLAQLVGSDLGFVSPSRFAATLTTTLDTLDRLERHRGHLLNWYETHQLRPLAPRYVSTVDSGNLAACALTLRAGLDDVVSRPLPRPEHADGVAAALEILAETLERFRGIEPFAPGGLPATLRRIALELQEARADPLLFSERLAALESVGLPTLETDVAEALETPRSRPSGGSLGEVREWVRGVDRQVSALHEELATLVPWLAALREPPPFSSGDGSTQAVRSAWASLAAAAEPSPTLAAIPTLCEELLRRLDILDAAVLVGAPSIEEGAELPREASLRSEAERWSAELRSGLHTSRKHAEALLASFASLRGRLAELVAGMDFAFLYDPARKLLRVGYHVDGATLDRSYYDLYASEARIASYLAIAKGDVPVEHWTHLGRPFARRDGATVLLSWAGTMFEYLMPSLFLRTPPGSLADVAIGRAIDAQARHAPGPGLPWGASESGYYQTDSQKRYRYRAFGVPELSVRRDPSGRVVTAPYASLLALPFQPRRVWRNVLRLEAIGALGTLGLYEAADFGRARSRRPQIVRSFMAHHQGMILAAIDNYLHDGVLVERFHRDPRTARFEYLLREAAPGRVRLQPKRATEPLAAIPRPAVPPALPLWPVDADVFPPPTTVVSNGALSSLLTVHGGGGLRWLSRDVLRWRPDPTAQEWGSWIYVRDVESGRLWSATAAPTWVEPDRYEVVFGAHSVEFQREDDGIAMRTTVCVAAAGNVEIRRITLVNETPRRRVLELTSFAEVALSHPQEDRRHPAFSKLFVEGRYASRLGALLFARRPRGDERGAFLAHTVVTAHRSAGPIGWQLDRAEFVGRGGSMRDPRGAREPAIGRMANRVWAPLDPIMSLTARVELPAGEELSLAFLTAVADEPATALAAVDAYRSPDRALFALSQARDRERALLQDLAIQGAQLAGFQRLLTAIVFPYHGLRGAAQAAPAVSDRRQESLWAAGVSGDLPLVVLEVETDRDPLVDELVRAWAYWERHNVHFDLVLVDTSRDGYAEPLRGRLTRLLTELGVADRLEHRGGVHHLPSGRLTEPSREALRGAASVAFIADGRSLEAHLATLDQRPARLPPFVPVPSPAPPEPEVAAVARRTDLLFENRWGGFAPEDRAYVIHLEPGRPTPAPWTNVLAHPSFGCIASESGGGCTWTENSGERRLTTWRNDPVLDAPSEVVYLRDEESGSIWSATASPAGAAAPYEVQHRAGITTYLHRSHGLEHRLRVFVPPGERAKVVELSLTNERTQPRRLTVTYYAEWVLGVHRWETGPHLVTEVSRPDRAIFARNGFSPSMADVVAFLGGSEPIHAFTCDRFEFLGPAGEAARPEGLARIGLDGHAGAHLDPCAALQIHVDMTAGQNKVVRFVLGAAGDLEEARATLSRLRDPGSAEEARGRATAFWDELLDEVVVETPEPSMDLLLNRWLLYQTVACRLWGRSALYQSSGAIGFRDQLQDSLALRRHQPELTRHQILEAARHQFTEGDVLHWWHSESGRGVRTRCSDDLLWLPFAVAEYIDATGDASVLDEPVAFLSGAPLEPDQVERYDTFPQAAPGSLYDHCLAAIDRAGGRSPRGLPFIGSGDWNDALNRVGIAGRGESVWLAWFLYEVQTGFARLCERRGDSGRARALRADAERLRRAVETHCWDGAWYQRATYDDGTPLGTHEADEGSIDSLTQSWAVLSGGADPERARTAMASVERHLVRPQDRLVLLLTPPFHATEKDPGYIRSYPPGVRENGGQYTHAATWVGLAFAELGDGERAEEIFRLLNPILRTVGEDQVARYRVEPYVLAGDVYGAEPHVGRGGWTWYTGSAGWMYRLGLEGVLGLYPARGGVRIRPCIPPAWSGYEIRIRVGEATCYRITVRNPRGVSTGVAEVSLDGRPLPDAFVPLHEDGRDHVVDVELGPPREPVQAAGSEVADPDAVGTLDGGGDR